MAKYKPKSAAVHTIYKNAAGKRLPGVTTITGQIGKPFLVKWAANLVKDGTDYDAYMDEVKKIGTATHEIILAGLEGRPPEVDSFSPEQLKWARGAAEKTLDWATDPAVDLKLISSEVPLVSEKYQVGGTLDLYCTLNWQGKNVKAVIDFKTSDSGLYMENFVQSRAYTEFAIENGMEAEFFGCVRAPKDTSQSMEIKLFPVESDAGTRSMRMFKGLVNQYTAIRDLKKVLEVR